MENEFIAFAKDDLDMSLLAYQSKKYSNAVFLIQQANEKAMKSILIASGIDYATLKKDSHDAIKPIIRFIKNQHEQSQKDINTIKNNFAIEESSIFGPKHKEIYNRFKESIADFESFKSMDWKKIDEEFILELLEELEELKSMEFVFSVNKKMAIQIQNMINTEMPILKLIPDIEKKLLDIFNSEQKTILFIRFMNIMINLSMATFKPHIISYIMNLILFPHFSDSRYPTENKFEYNTYDEKHPIIKHYMKLFELTKLSIEEINKFFKSDKHIEEMGAIINELFGEQNINSNPEINNDFQ